jgi:hypothetical protein
MKGHTKGQIRRYIRIWGTTVSKLSTWSQRRCVKCQRFLSKNQNKYCANCAEESYRLKDLNQRRDKYFVEHPNIIQRDRKL